MEQKALPPHLTYSNSIVSDQVDAPVDFTLIALAGFILGRKTKR